MTHIIHLAIPQFQSLLVILVRIGGILSAWPILGSPMIPVQIKVSLVMVLGLVLLPVVHITGLPNDPLPMTFGMTAEFLVGMVIGLAVRLVFAGIELAGELIGSQMGLSIAPLIDPSTANQVPLISHFHTLLASLIFLSLNAHFAVVQAVASSFDLIKPFGAGLSAPLVEDVLRISQGLFVTALKLAAPILATTLLINLGLAILGRSVPQINVFLLSFPLTIAGGFLVLGAALPYAVRLYESEYVRLLETVQGLIRLLGHAG